MSTVPAATSASRKSRPQIDLTVIRREQLSPHMVRIIAGGEDEAFADALVAAWREIASLPQRLRA